MNENRMDWTDLAKMAEHKQMGKEAAETSGLSARQTKRMNELRSYMQKTRSESEDKVMKELCTNVLAWVILIESDQ